MNIIKNTKTICPQCKKEVPGIVYEESDSIYLLRDCLEHGQQSSCIEKDKELYLSLCNQSYRQEQAQFQNLALPLTQRCNLNCHVCYRDENAAGELSFERACKIINAFSGKMIWLTGGEPTTVEFLPALIQSVVASSKIPVLITNGVKLAQRQYVRLLKKSGLRWVHISFNGFSDDSYKKINGQPLLAIKKKALRNLEREQMNVALSFLHVPEVNEHELKQVISFCYANRHFISQLRIRTQRHIGKSIASQNRHMSDLLNQVSDSLGVSRQDMIKYVNQKSPVISDYQAQHMPCHAEIDMDDLFAAVKGRTVSWREKIACLRASLDIRRLLSLCNSKIPWSDKQQRFKIKIRAWPDRETIDLGEMHHCVSGYWIERSNTIVPFCLGVCYEKETDALSSLVSGARQ